MCCSLGTRHSSFICAFLLGIPVACLHRSLQLLHTQWCLSGVCSRLHLPTGSRLVKVGVGEGVRLHLLGEDCLCKLLGILIYGSVVSPCCLFDQGTFYMLGYNLPPRHPASPLVPAVALGALSGSPVSPGRAPLLSPSEHLLHFWGPVLLQAHLVSSLPQPRNQPFLQGALSLPWRVNGAEARVWSWGVPASGPLSRQSWEVRVSAPICNHRHTRIHPSVSPPGLACIQTDV